MDSLEIVEMIHNTGGLQTLKERGMIQLLDRETHISICR